jgi:hypothetical protein
MPIIRIRAYFTKLFTVVIYHFDEKRGMGIIKLYGRNYIRNFTTSYKKTKSLSL